MCCCSAVEMSWKPPVTWALSRFLSITPVQKYASSTAAAESPARLRRFLKIDVEEKKGLLGSDAFRSSNGWSKTQLQVCNQQSCLRPAVFAITCSRVRADA